MIGEALDGEGDGDDPAAPGGFPGDEPEAPPFKPSPSASPTDDAGLEAAPPFKGTAIDLGGAARLATLEVERPDEPAALGDEALTASRPLDVPKVRGPASDLPPNPYPTAAPSPPPTTVEPAPEAVVDRGLVLSTSSGPDGTLVARLSGATDTLAAFRGTASLMLTDPRAEGKHKRIARWDYTAAEVSGLLASGAQALELLVQLPEATPTDRPLRLWVRLVDAKGARRLQAADVLLTGAPLRLAVAPQRLPKVEGPSRDFGPVPATSSAGWRPVREDRLVVPAGYDAAAE
jgi:hypothetical protein